MPDIEYEEKVIVKKKIVVDDRVYDTDSKDWRIANALLNGGLNKATEELYNDDPFTIRNTAQRINDAFATVDKINLIRE